MRYGAIELTLVASAAVRDPLPTQPAVDVRPPRRGAYSPQTRVGPASASRACHGAVDASARDPQGHRRPRGDGAERGLREHVAEAAEVDLRVAVELAARSAARRLDRPRPPPAAGAQAGAARVVSAAAATRSVAGGACPWGLPGRARARPVGARSVPSAAARPRPNSRGSCVRPGPGRAAVLDGGEIRRRRRSAAPAPAAGANPGGSARGAASCSRGEHAVELGGLVAQEAPAVAQRPEVGDRDEHDHRPAARASPRGEIAHRRAPPRARSAAGRRAG